MANYYVVQDGDSTGPFDRDRLAQMIAARTLLPDSLVWTADMNDWAPARDVPDIVGLFPDPPPPPVPAKRPPPPRGVPEPLFSFINHPLRNRKRPTFKNPASTLDCEC